MFWCYFFFLRFFRSRDLRSKPLVNPGIWTLTLLCLPGLTWAQTVQITEIAPHTLALEPEWFEFYVDDPGADMSGWQLSNGSSPPKKFSDHLDKLHEGENGYHYFLPSPLGLPNNGGTIQILDGAGVVLSEVIYPEAKSSSTKNYEQREVWNWSQEYQQLIPQLVRAPTEPGFEHSRGQENSQLPSPSTVYSLLINEASPDHLEQDFIELLVVDGPDEINLQYAELKHNGTVLWRWNQPYWVHPGDYLLFKVGTPDQGKAGTNLFHTKARDGLSGGSGTVELVRLSDTSLEARADAVCWQSKSLSQTEQSRVDKFVTEGDWNGPCVEIQDLVKNESVARRSGGADSNTLADFWRHFNGSPGADNLAQNQAPTAVITVQGSGKTVGAVSFFLNVSGQDSTDPDGAPDIKSYQWRLGDEVISTKANPAGFYIEAEGEALLTLTVTDQSGESHTSEQLIVGLPPEKRNTTNGSKKAKQAVVQALLQESLPASAENSSDGFFGFYLAKTEWIEALQAPPPKYPNYPEAVIKKKTYVTYDPAWPRKINLPEPVRQRAKKNLGVLFSWRAAPWPDLAAEWTAVVAGDQRFGYFGGVYLGF